MSLVIVIKNDEGDVSVFADTRFVNEDSSFVDNQRKVFVKNDIIVSFAGPVDMGLHVVSNKTKIPRFPKYLSITSYEYILNYVVPAIKLSLTSEFPERYLTEEDAKYSDKTDFIIVHNNNIFIVDEDFVLSDMTTTRYAAIGITDAAIGLWLARSMKIIRNDVGFNEFISRCFEITAAINSGVSKRYGWIDMKKEGKKYKTYEFPPA